VVSPSFTVGEGSYGHLLGVMESHEWTPVDVALGPGAQLLLYTDGLIEGWAGPDDADRFGLERLTVLIAELAGAGLAGTDLLDALLAQVQRCNGGPMTDDVALCLVSIPEIAGSPPRGG
jgi:serine phosphatase RsbU (regulator of sigma subunit)